MNRLRVASGESQARVDSADPNGSGNPKRSNSATSEDYFVSNAFPRMAVNPVTGCIDIVHADLPFAGSDTDRGDIFINEGVPQADGSLNWTGERKVNHDGTVSDHRNPSIAINAAGTQLFAGSYSRQADSANNALIEAYRAKANLANGLATATFEVIPISSTAFPPLFPGALTSTPPANTWMYDHVWAQAGVCLNTSAFPPVEAGWYFVEEAPPSGWEVGAINAGGFFDPVRRTVNFGPFLDREPRELEYEITPPTGETGLRQFLGSVTTETAETPIGGDTTLEAVPLHPADLPATDAWLTLAEVTAYGAAWKSGASWPFAPASIPLEYVTRASALWRGGEAYTWETGATNPPSGWINLTNPPSPAVVPPSIPPGAATSLGRISATQPRFYQPGEPLSILLVATPAAEVRVYAVEDQPPTGWTVGSVSHGGTVDPLRGKVKWGPFFDPLPRELSYQLVAPGEAMDVTGLTGGAAFDGEVAEATGPRAIYPAGTDLRPSLSNLRWDGGTGSAMTLRGLTNEIYVIEASVNLIDWEPLTTLTNTLGTLEYQDATAVEIPARAYRVLWP